MKRRGSSPPQATPATDPAVVAAPDAADAAPATQDLSLADTQPLPPLPVKRKSVRARRPPPPDTVPGFDDPTQIIEYPLEQLALPDEPGWRQRLQKLGSLKFALLVSLAAHAAVLSVRFVGPENISRAFRDTPLEVILVNARSKEAPDQAQAIAQANLAGGGEAEKGRATSPLPAAATVQLGDAVENARKRIQHLQEEQQQLLTQIRRELAILPTPERSTGAGTPQERELEERRRQLLRLLAEIEKRINDENAKPKRRYISPATREEVYALYYDKLRRRIEEKGTTHFPEHEGRKLYGELTMNVTVDAEGRVVEADIITRSKSRRLDAQALSIVRTAAPFGPFSDAMRAKADQIVVTSRFRFTREDGFETSLSSR